MATVETIVADRWKTYAIDAKQRRCDRRGRTHDDEGTPLVVRRQPRRRFFECLDCFDHRGGR